MTSDALCMPRPASSDRHPGHYLRQWRKASGYSLEYVCDQLRDRLSAQGLDKDRRRVGATHSNLSRIERGEVPYNQTLIDMLAELYGTDSGSLIMRDPSDPEELWSLLAELDGREKRQVAEIARALKRTGTFG